MKRLAYLAGVCGLGLGSLQVLAGAPEPALRTVPQPRPEHPGNIFLQGEEVVVPLPAQPAGPWQLSDGEDRPLSEVTPQQGKVSLGPLPVGFYRLRPAGTTNPVWVSLGVLAPLQAPTPRTSPIGLDVAMAWFYPPDRMEAVASLCVLAGVNWVRDRLNWKEMEPRRGEWAGPNRYDASARAQAQAGLQVLQVHHHSPDWANPNGKRFPLDLRDTYHFHREMARRWQGQVQAFEPWNEADIPMFGGHTGSEMASFQKAAWLGLKAGHPPVIAALNDFALSRAALLEDFERNEAWPYFDTFTFHHYVPFDGYAKVYAAFRAVSGGKPLWVTEAALPVKWAGDERLKEPTDADLRVQAERVAKTFALSIHEGSVATFYFLLPHYVEGQTQFGLLRPDLTPRPAYLALAAVGRLLADARPLGRWPTETPNVRAYLFAARPDGREREVLVAWASGGTGTLTLPATAESIFDQWGRSLEPGTVLTLGEAPRFVVWPAGTAARLGLTPPPALAPLQPGEPSPIVLQSLWPEDQIAQDKSAYRIRATHTVRLPVYAYNFDSRPAHGTLHVTAPAGWKAGLEGSVELAPMDRKELTLTLEGSGTVSTNPISLRVAGDFGPAGRPVLSFQVLPEP